MELNNLSTQELSKALESLKIASNLLKDSYIQTPQNIELQKALRDACIQRFKFCVELSWKTSIKLLGLEIKSPNIAIRDMARNNLIDQPDIWFDLLTARNKTSHTYDEEVAKEVYQITQSAIPHFDQLLKKLESISIK